MLSNPLECPSWVNLRHSPGVPPTSGAGGRADEIDTITDIGQRMSAVGGIADVVCQGLSGPFIAISGLLAFQPTVRIFVLIATMLNLSDRPEASKFQD